MHHDPTVLRAGRRTATNSPPNGVPDCDGMATLRRGMCLPWPNARCATGVRPTASRLRYGARMLFPRPVLDGIARGEITLAFRRWDRPRVRAGTHLRTAIGLIAVESVDAVDPARISQADARRAGHADRAGLLAVLDRYGDRTDRPVFRVAVRPAGDDPRIELRQRDDLPPDEADEVLARLARLDRASRHGPWTERVLRLIARRPGERAADLAVTEGREKLPFKTDVRKLKELGLTESLLVGYRLSPRGRAYLERTDS